MPLHPYRASSRSIHPCALLVLITLCSLTLAACVGGGGGGGGKNTSDQQSVSLSWNIAGERENGEKMDEYGHDIEGHEVVYRLEGESSWSGSVFESNDLWGTTIGGLTSGTYYFAARTKDTDGRWSDYSEELMVQVN